MGCPWQMRLRYVPWRVRNVGRASVGRAVGQGRADRGGWLCVAGCRGGHRRLSGVGVLRLMIWVICRANTRFLLSIMRFWWKNERRKAVAAIRPAASAMLMTCDRAASASACVPWSFQHCSPISLTPQFPGSYPLPSSSGREVLEPLCMFLLPL